LFWLCGGRRTPRRASDLPTRRLHAARVGAVGVDLIEPRLQAAKRCDEQGYDNGDPLDVDDLDDLLARVAREVAQSIEQTLVFDDGQPIEIVHQDRTTERDFLGDVRPRALLGEQLMNTVASR
jgi:hypothetical protein